MDEKPNYKILARIFIDATRRVQAKKITNLKSDEEDQIQTNEED